MSNATKSQPATCGLSRFEQIMNSFELNVWAADAMTLLTTENQAAVAEVSSTIDAAREKWLQSDSAVELRRLEVQAGEIKTQTRQTESDVEAAERDIVSALKTGHDPAEFEQRLTKARERLPFLAERARLLANFVTQARERATAELQKAVEAARVHLSMRMANEKRTAEAAAAKAIIGCVPALLRVRQLEISVTGINPKEYTS